MNLLQTFWQRFRSLFQSRAVKQEIDEELRFHLEMREQENLRAGMSPKEAAREARRRFGNLQCVREECRDLRGANFLETVLQDIRFGVRMLWKNPGFTTVAALTLALGIGLNTSMFSTLRRLLFQQLPFSEPDRLVRVLGKSPAGEDYYNHSAGDYFDARDQSVALEHISAYAFGHANISGDDAVPENVTSLKVTADFFTCLGISPLFGRFFDSKDEQPGRDPVALIGRSLWMRRFGGDTNIVGRTLRLNGKSVTVIGVIPESINSLLFGMPMEIVRPLALSSDQRNDHGNQWLNGLIGRLKPGLSLAQARAEWTIISARPERAKVQYRLQLVPLARGLVNGSGGRLFWMLFALTGFVLLIACANLANLQLSRMVARSRELGIRAALGAGRGRLARQLLTESVMLSLLGGALGLLLAVVCNHVLSNQLNIDRTDYHIVIPIDRSVVLFALGISFVTGIVVGTAPAWLMVRADVNPALKDNVRSSGSTSRHRLQNTLIAAEIALATMLLACTGGIGLEILKTLTRDPGWKPDGLLVGDIMLSGPDYDSFQKKKIFAQRLQERVASLPGVKGVSVSSGLPFEGYCWWRVIAEGQPRNTEQNPLVSWNNVNENYFKTLEMTLRQGRNFTMAEVENNSAVTIINEKLANKLWPGQNPVGKRISWVENPVWLEVVGVANDVADAEGFRGFRPLGETDAFSIILRVAGAPGPLTTVLRQTVAEIDPNLPVRHIQTAGRVLENSKANEKAIVGMIGGFGALGMLLAAIGVYGVTSQLVTQRTGEFGIRMALGEPQRNVLWLVVRGGLRVSMVGALLGIVGCIGTVRLLKSILPEFGERDVTCFWGIPMMGWIAVLIAAVVLIAVALFACWLPARRATRINPMTALRCE